MSARSRLIGMLGTMRPAGSLTEWRFLQRFVFPTGAELDSAGNVHLVIPRKDGSLSAVLWSCHTDTVHRAEGTQRVVYDALTGQIRLAAGETASCLGADDTVGVWLCLEMIRAKVPGHYVFHYGEERGGIGSRAIVRDEPERFAAIEYAIALDRCGTADIITHQSGGRCCSDVFAWSLAQALDLDYQPCDSGVYTDTAEYVGIVAECTNLSVGYYRQHSAGEWVGVAHALELRRALLTFDESLLIADADNARDECDRDWPAIGDSSWRDYDGPAIDADYLTDEEAALLYNSATEDTDPEDDDGWEYGQFGRVCDLTAADRAYLQQNGYAIRKRFKPARLH